MDGDLDLVFGGGWLSNDGFGGFSGDAAAAMNGWPEIAVGDIDADGDPDYATPSGSVLQNVSGVFTTTFTITMADPWSSTLELGDMDGDGDADAVVGDNWLVSVYFSDGAGSFFSVGPPADVSGAESVRQLYDFDSDGDLDVICTGGSGVTVLQNDGSGSLTHLVSTDAPSDRVMVGRLDGNADSDLAAAASLSSIQVTLDDRRGGLNPRSVFGLAQPWQMGSADLDGDGARDLAVAQAGGAREFSVFLNDGTGNLVAASALGSISYAIDQPLALGDITGDGFPDALLAESSEVVVVINDGTGRFSVQERIATAVTPYRLMLHDLDGDLHADAGLVSGGGAVLWWNRGDGTFGDITTVAPAGSLVVAMRAADMDSDGAADLVLGAVGSTYIVHNDGGHVFTQIAQLDPGLPTHVFEVTDVDGDGDPDVAMSDVDYNLSLALNDGSGARFTIVSVPMEARLANSFSSAELDGVPGNEILVGDADLGTLVIGLVGQGRFLHRYTLKPAPDQVLGGDFDGDGIGDALVGIGSPSLFRSRP